MSKSRLESSKFGPVKSAVDVLDAYGPLYEQLSGGKASDYEDYVGLGLADEETLIKPTLFPEFLSSVLDFSKIDYTPEHRGTSQKRPDFTPNDMLRHPFIFETKGSDSSKEDLIAEYHSKSKGYLQSIPSAQYVIISNMSDLIVFAKGNDRPLDEYSFSFRALYLTYKQKAIVSIHDKNLENFLHFVQKFGKKPLSTEDKVKAIANAKTHEVRTTEIPYEYETLTDSIRKIVDWLREDARTRRGPTALAESLVNLPRRKRAIAMEILAIRGEISMSHEIPEKITAEDLGEFLRSRDRTILQAVELYFYRVAYFLLVRILLVRAWEDSGFIREDFQTLFNGGFARWYFKTFNTRIADVLRQAFAFAKEKYEWLYTEETNYSWYLPTDEILVDVLYELAKYNLSVLNRDVLGAVYEDYLDAQDKKNKGQYYTPFPIVNLVWNRIGYDGNKDFFRFEGGRRSPKRVFDPATGSGGFLVEAARRLRTLSRPRNALETLLDVKNAIVTGLYGSEISVFSYYITEVNLLIQLTPVIRSIIDLEPERRDIEGKFALSVVRQDSLSLHNQPETIDEGVKPKADEHARYGLELLKPIGEKLRVYESIKDSADFDYAVANPPYIGEDGHKELFRKTLDLYPYWKTYFQGKMDYLYFFIILAIQKLRSGGRLGFITTSYWLTADGASKLRKYILEKTKIIEIINFHEIKLFEHAKGQHNIVFILERDDNPERRHQNRIKIVETGKQFDGPNVETRIQALCNHIEKHIAGSQYTDDHVRVYHSPISQGDLSEKPWYLFHKKHVESLLKRIESAGVALETLCDVHQGIVPGCLSVDKTVLECLPQKTISEYGVKEGMGVFVLDRDEVKALNLTETEKDIVRPYYKNSSIHRYVVDQRNESYLIYTNKDTQIKDYPNILRYLGIFKPRLELKRETQAGRLPWWSLHWPREEYIFEGKKIVCPYRSLVNTFAYSENAFYGSTDMYFITQKRDTKLDNKIVDLRYVLGVLNSVVIRLWTQHRTKPKGRIRELFYSPLCHFPIKPIDFKDHHEVSKYSQIVEWVQQIIDLKRSLLKYDSLFRPRLTELMEEEELPTLDEIEAIPLLNPRDVKTLRTSAAVSYDRVPKEFDLRKVLGIESTALRKSKFSHQLVIQGSNNKIITIEGEYQILQFLRDRLGKMKGSSWNDIESIRLPTSMNILKRCVERIKREVVDTRQEVKKLQSKIDRNVCELYNIGEEDIREGLSKSENG